jgi:hypothetical protein
MPAPCRHELHAAPLRAVSSRPVTEGHVQKGYYSYAEGLLLMLSLVPYSVSVLLLAIKGVRCTASVGEQCLNVTINDFDNDVTVILLRLL